MNLLLSSGFNFFIENVQYRKEKKWSYQIFTIPQFFCIEVFLNTRFL